jgi:hypothetical protein
MALLARQGCSGILTLPSAQQAEHLPDNESLVIQFLFLLLNPALYHFPYGAITAFRKGLFQPLDLSFDNRNFSR